MKGEAPVAISARRAVMGYWPTVIAKGPRTCPTDENADPLASCSALGDSRGLDLINDRDYVFHYGLQVHLKIHSPQALSLGVANIASCLGGLEQGLFRYTSVPGAVAA